MVIKRGGPSLIGRAARTAGRTAIIAGTATAVSGKVAASQAAKTPQAAAGLSDDALIKLGKLAELHKNGALTDEEFAAQKAKLLA